MENELQAAEVLSEEPVLSPAELLKAQWTQQSGLAFLRQRSLIVRSPEMLQMADSAGLRGWLSPRAFALQGLLIASLALSLLAWTITHSSGPLQDQITALHADTQEELKRQQGVMDAMQAEVHRVEVSSHSQFRVAGSDGLLPKEEALQKLNALLDDAKKSKQDYLRQQQIKENELAARQSALALAHSVAPFIFSLSLMLAAALVGAGIRRDYRKSPTSLLAEEFYLYFVTAEGLLPGLVILILLHFALSGPALGFTRLFDSLGPIFWIVFWIGFYVLAGRIFLMVARNLYRSLQIRPPANEYDLGNKMLVRIHNGFWMVFLTLEAVVMLLCYLYYLAASR